MPRLLLGSLLLALVASSPVLADAIEGPPACPPGSQGRSSHEGRWCVPATCAADSECPGVGQRCQPYRVCTRGSEVPPAGMGQFREGAAPRRTTVVIGTCSIDAACTGDEEPPPPVIGTLDTPTQCEDARFCVPASLPALPARARAAPSSETSPATSPTSPTASSAGAQAPAANRGGACGVGGDPRAAGGFAMMALGLALFVRRKS